MDRFQEEFRELMAQGSLADLETRDGWFTWNKKQGGENLVSSRIDIFLVSKNIVRGVGEISDSVLPVAGSDHWPIGLNWDWSNANLRKHFWF